MIAWFAALALAQSEPAALGVVDRVAAVVNNDVIALSEVYELGGEFVGQRCPDMAEGCIGGAELEVLDALIRRVLMRQELTKLDMDITAAEVDRAIDATVQQYALADREALRAEVEASNVRWDQYRDQLMESLRKQAFQGRVLAPRVSVTEDEARDMYQRTARSVSRPVVKLSGLGIPITPETTPAEQERILDQTNQLVEMINSGRMTWAEAVKRYDAGFAGMFATQEFDKDTIIEPLAGVVEGAPVGAVQAPVRVPSPSGVDVLFVVKVDERTTKSRAAAFEDVRQELENQLFQQKLADAEEEWYQRARREAAIDIKLGKS